jgi:hypothetical protein
LLSPLIKAEFKCIKFCLVTLYWTTISSL